MTKTHVILPLATALAASPAAAGNLTIPDCDTLQAWVAADSDDHLRLAPDLSISPALAEEQLVPVFGLKITEWDPEDIKAARAAAHECYQQARRGDNKQAAPAFRAARTLIARGVGRTSQRVTRAREMVAERRAAVDALPDSPDLAAGISMLVDAQSYADTDRRAFNSLPQEVGGALENLYNALRHYPDDEREALYTGLAERAAGIRAGLLDDAAAAIAAAPDSAAGLLAVRHTAFEVKQRTAGSPTGEAAEVLDAATERAAAIEATLAQRDDAWRPPSCAALYRWGGAPGAGDFRELGEYAHKAAFGDDRLTPVFGLPLADWSDDHLALYGQLAELCEARWRALLPEGHRLRRPGPDAPELVRLASAGSWVSRQATVTRDLPEAREALRGYAKVREKLDALRAELATLPTDQRGLDRLEAIAREPVLRRLGHAEGRAFREDLRKTRGRVTAGMGQAIIAGLADIEVKQPADLRTLWRYREQAGLHRLDPSTRALVEARLDKAVRDGLAAARPAYDAALAALPASKSGVEKALTAASELTGIPESTPALAPYLDAGRERARGILAELEQQRCRKVWARLGVDDDEAAQALWTGNEKATVGTFLCALERAGHTVNAYDGAGMFSDTHTLKFTSRDRVLQSLSLHEAEVTAGEEMLIGYEVEDANRHQELSAADWRRYVDGLTGGGGSVECARLMNTPMDQLSMNERMAIIGCTMQ